MSETHGQQPLPDAVLESTENLEAWLEGAHQRIGESPTMTKTDMAMARDTVAGALEVINRQRAQIASMQASQQRIGVTVPGEVAKRALQWFTPLLDPDLAGVSYISPEVRADLSALLTALQGDGRAKGGSNVVSVPL